MNKVYGEENGYGVRVWRDSVSHVFSTDAQGYDRSGNQHVPAHGRGDSFTNWEVHSIPGVDNAFYYTFDDYYAVWFLDRDQASKFKQNVKAFQKTLPKFDITSMLD